jgi:SAM-dependent methyltransferase
MRATSIRACVRAIAGSASSRSEISDSESAMGFIRANTTLILKEHKRRPFGGRLLCLGAPDVYFGYDVLQELAYTLKVPIDRSVPVRHSPNPDLAARGCISGETLFKSLGFESVDALDVSDFENASIVYDLNDPDTPAELCGRFDAIVDHGTLEHVFHLPNALQNLFRMLKVGGRVIHSLPTSNLVDHGFYMFSPTLFHDFYSANDWDINNIYVVSMTPRDHETDTFEFVEYQPGDFDQVSYGGLDGKAYFTVSFVTKTPVSTGHVIPQQGAYRKKWSACGLPRRE